MCPYLFVFFRLCIIIFVLGMPFITKNNPELDQKIVILNQLISFDVSFIFTFGSTLT